MVASNQFWKKISVKTINILWWSRSFQIIQVAKLIWVDSFKIFAQGRGEIYLCKLIFAVSPLKEEEINDLKTTEIKIIRVRSCGVLGNACSLTASGKILQDVFRTCRFNEVAGQKVYCNKCSFYHLPPGRLPIQLPVSQNS